MTPTGTGDDEQRAAIIAVDDDAVGLAALARVLVDRYGSSYDIRCLATPAAARAELEALTRAGRPVALVLAAQWMEGQRGAELLAHAAEVAPAARRLLLITWGDRSAAQPILEAISLGHVEFYVPRPAADPDETFHAVVTDFLADWAKAEGRGFTPIVAVIDPATPRAAELRDLFARHGLVQRVHHPDSATGRALLSRAGMTGGQPVVFVLDGPPLLDPTNATLADALAVRSTGLGEQFDVAIVGAGPAGLGAAVYAASEGLRTVVLERESLGGQAGTSSLIRNYLGFPAGIRGSELAVRAFEQAWLFGAQFAVMREAVALEVGSPGHVLVLSDGSRIEATTVVLTGGATYRLLEVATLESYVGCGVHYGAATAEAVGLRGRRVVIAGGGNSAGQAAVHLARYAATVTIVIRGDDLGASMSEYLVTQISAASRIDVRTGTEITGAEGEGRLERLHLRARPTGVTTVEPCDALFVMIGAHPRTAWLPEEIARDEWGYVLTGNDVPRDVPQDRPRLPLETSVPGVFAAGDIRHRSVKRVAAAAGEGSTVITLVHRYLTEQGQARPAG